MNFSNITSWIIPEGTVTQVTDSLNRVIWQKTQPVPPTPENTYFYIEDLSGSSNTLVLQGVSDSSYINPPTIEVFYSTDKVTWTSIGTTSRTPITATIIPANGKLYLKAITNAWGHNAYSFVRIGAAGSHNVGGNIMSLLYGDNYQNQTSFPNGSDSNFFNLFNYSTTLVNANQLILPATTLAQSCYRDMFQNCTALTTVPTLPATTLAGYCYRNMFNGCSNLATVTTYAQDISASNCLVGWLYGVASTGDFYNLGGATYPSGVDGIPTGWTIHTSL